MVFKLEEGRLDPRLWGEWEYQDRYFIDVDSGIELINAVAAYTSGDKSKWRSKKYEPRDMYIVELIKYFFGVNKGPTFKIKTYIGSPTPVFELTCHHPPIFIGGHLRIDDDVEPNIFINNFFNLLGMKNMFTIKERHRVFSVSSLELNKDLATCHVSEIIYTIGFQDPTKSGKKPIILQDLEFGLEKNEKITAAEIGAFKTFFKRFVDFDKKISYSRYNRAIEEFSKWSSN